MKTIWPIKEQKGFYKGFAFEITSAFNEYHPTYPRREYYLNVHGTDCGMFLGHVEAFCAMQKVVSARILSGDQP